MDAGSIPAISTKKQKTQLKGLCLLLFGISKMAGIEQGGSKRSLRKKTARGTVSADVATSDSEAIDAVASENDRHLHQKKTNALTQSVGLFQRNKSLAEFVKYSSRVKYGFAI